jgi:integrase
LIKGGVLCGHWPGVSLKQARADAYDKWFKLRYRNADPQDVRKVSKGQRTTFPEAAQEYLRLHGPRHGDRWHRQFKLFTDIYAEKLSRKSVWGILPNDVKDAIAPVFERGAWRTGRDVLSLWEDIFYLARVRGWRVFENPAQWKDLHEHNFPAPPDLEVESHPSLHYSEMPEFVKALCLHQANGVGAILLEFVILTALRPNQEARLIQWNEIDFENRILAIPAKRMKKRKNRKEAFFRVPLSDRAIAILLHQKQRATGPFVFPGRTPNKAVAEHNMIKLMRNTMGIPHEGQEAADVHGFRTSFRVWGRKNKFDYEALEKCLDHVVGSKTARSDIGCRLKVTATPVSQGMAYVIDSGDAMDFRLQPNQM